MATLTPLVVNGNVDVTGLRRWTRSGGSWTDAAAGAYVDIDDAVGTVADGDDGAAPVLDHNSTVTSKFALTAVDSDFNDMVTLNFHYDVEMYAAGSLGDDTGYLEIKVTNGAETSDYVATTRLHTWNGSSWTDTTPAANLTKSLTLTAAGLSASKTDWDAARLHVTYNNTKNKAADGAWPIILVDCELTGTYNVASSVPELSWEIPQQQPYPHLPVPVLASGAGAPLAPTLPVPELSWEVPQQQPHPLLSVPVLASGADAPLEPTLPPPAVPFFRATNSQPWRIDEGMVPY